MSRINKSASNVYHFCIGKYGFNLNPYLLLILFLAFISLVAVVIYSQNVTPLYQATAGIVLPKEQTNAELNGVLNSQGLSLNRNSLENNIDILRSDTLINQVVQDLKLYAPVSVEEESKNVLVYNNSPIAITARYPGLLKRFQKIYFKVLDSKVVIQEVAYPINRFVNTPYGMLMFTKNKYQHKHSNTNKAFFFTLIPAHKITDALSSRLEIKIKDDRKGFVELNLKDENSARGTAIIADLIKFGDSAIQHHKSENIEQARKLINDSLKKAEYNLLTIEQKLPSENKPGLSGDYKNKEIELIKLEVINDQKLREIERRLFLIDQSEKYVESNAFLPGRFLQNLNTINHGLALMINKFNSFQMEARSSKYEILRKQLLKDIKIQKQELFSIKENLVAQQQIYFSKLHSKYGDERKAEFLSNNLKLERDSYTSLLEKKEETELSSVANDTSIRVNKTIRSDKLQTIDVIHDALSSTDLSPAELLHYANANVIYLSSILLAILTGVTIASGKENSLKDFKVQHKIVKDRFPIPVIYEIAKVNSDMPFQFPKSKDKLIEKQFSNLMSSLISQGIGAGKRKILVTSEISQQGKSYVAINLAKNFASNGKKTILLDFDFGNPSLNQIQESINKPGIADLLNGDTILNDSITRSTENKNLYFIPAGYYPGNSLSSKTNLLPIERIKELFFFLENSFSYIVINVAPLGITSDGCILSPLCDTTLYIINHFYSPKIIVEKSDKISPFSSLNKPVLMFNDLSERNFSEYYN